MRDIKPVRVFLKVVELSSFAAAARTLNMTPASVTRIVARLEKDLGQQLLVRTTRQVSMTTAGAMVAARYGPIVSEFDQVTDEITRAARSDRGRLSINAPMSLGLQLMPSLVDRFRLAYPDITLEVHLTDALIDIVETRCDLAVRISGPPADKSTIWRKVCEVPRHLVAAPALFDRVARPEVPEDLDPSLCMSYSSSGRAENWKLSRGGRSRSLSAGDSVISNNGDFLYELVKAGNGIALLPDFIFSEGLATGEVEIVLTDWAAPPLWLTLFYPPYDALPPLVATFSDFFEAHLRDTTGLNFRAFS